MGARAQRQVLTALAALLLSASARAADSGVAPSTAAVEVPISTAAATADKTVVRSTAPAPGVPRLADDRPENMDSPVAPASGAVSQHAAAALRELVAAYNQKRRTVFMRYVSDDFTGDLGTLEDALSSDFRSYRTIDLAIVPQQVVAKGLKAQITFRFDLNVSDDLGKLTKMSGLATYTFIEEEKGKARLWQMDRAPIFGTSLSSVENPIPASQGAQTAVVNGCGGSISGSVVINAESSPSFDFATQTASTFGSGDINYSPGSPGIIITNSPAFISDLGPCSFSVFSQDPASINDTSDPANQGDCYAVLTRGGKYAAFYIVSFPPSAMSIQYKYQPSGTRCF